MSSNFIYILLLYTYYLVYTYYFVGKNQYDKSGKNQYDKSGKNQWDKIYLVEVIGQNQ